MLQKIDIKINNILKIILLIFFLSVVPKAYAEDYTNNQINIYLIHSNTCPHCKEEIKDLKKLEKQYKNVKVYKYEISDEKNEEIITEIKNKYKITMNAVPITIIGSEVYTGYSQEKTLPKIVVTLNYYKKYYNEYQKDNILNSNKEVFEETNKKIPTLEEYQQKNTNFQIMNVINSKDLDVSTAAMLLGIEQSFNYVNILLLVFISLIIVKTKNIQKKIILSSIYLTSIIIPEILKYFSYNNKYNIIIILLIILLMTILLILISHKPKQIINVLLPTVAILIIKIYFESTNINILEKIFNLNLIENFQKLLNILIYITTYLLVNILLLFAVSKIITKIYFDIYNKKIKTSKN